MKSGMGLTRFGQLFAQPPSTVNTVICCVDSLAFGGRPVPRLDPDAGKDFRVPFTRSIMCQSGVSRGIVL